MKKINNIILFQMIFLFIVAIGLFIYFINVTEHHKNNSNIKFICENNHLKYIENEFYKRDIWIASKYKIKCVIDGNDIIIKEGK